MTTTNETTSTEPVSTEIATETSTHNPINNTTTQTIVTTQTTVEEEQYKYNNLRAKYNLLQELNETLSQENANLKSKLEHYVQQNHSFEYNTATCNTSSAASVATAAAAAQLNNYQQALNLSEAQKQQVIAENDGLKARLVQFGVTFDDDNHGSVGVDVDVDVGGGVDRNTVDGNTVDVLTNTTNGPACTANLTVGMMAVEQQQHEHEHEHETDEEWDLKFNTLLKYKETNNGHLQQINYDDDPMMAKWTQTQRDLLRSTALQNDRADKLLSINFFEETMDIVLPNNDDNNNNNNNNNDDIDDEVTSGAVVAAAAAIDPSASGALDISAAEAEALAAVDTTVHHAHQQQQQHQHQQQQQSISKHSSYSTTSTAQKQAQSARDTRMAGRRRFYKIVDVTVMHPPWANLQEQEEEELKEAQKTIDNPISAGVDGTQSATNISLEKHSYQSMKEALDLHHGHDNANENENDNNTTTTTWYGITLDGRVMKTPLGLPLSVPSLPLALAIASEWDQQNLTIKPAQMPHMTMVCTTIDQLTIPSVRIDTINKILAYLKNDTTCYFADPTEDRVLYKRQSKTWEKLHQWIETDVKYGLGYKPAIAHGGSEGLIMSRFRKSSNKEAGLPHDEELMNQAKLFLHSCNAWTLAAMQNVTTEAKSFLVGMAVVRSVGIVSGKNDADAVNGGILNPIGPFHDDTKKAIKASRVEEEFQIENWGLVEGGHDYDRLNCSIQMHAATVLLQSIATASMQK